MQPYFDPTRKTTSKKMEDYLKNKIKNEDDLKRKKMKTTSKNEKKMKTTSKKIINPVCLRMTEKWEGLNEGQLKDSRI